jgi:O-antigen ligase
MTVLRIGLCAVIAFCVLAHGAVEVWSESLLEISAALLFALWAFLAFRDPNTKILWSPLNWPLLGFLAIGLGQLLLHATVYAFPTQTEMLKLLAYALVFFLAAQAFRERADLTKLVWFLVVLGFGVSLFGIVQHFTSPDNQIYWFRELTLGGDPFGPYVNRNHFAGFVELVVPVGLALMVFRGLRQDLFPMAALLTIVPIVALILSGSRGGIVGFGFELAVLALLVRSPRAPKQARTAAMGIVALIAIALIAWVGAGKAIERFSSLKPGDVSLGRRVTMFQGAVRVFVSHPVSGAGLGNLVTVFPRYDTFYDGKVVDHIHNDYIELLAETGLLGGLCGIAFLGIFFREAHRNFRAEQGHFSRALHAGAIVAVSGLLLHSFVDFNLHIPSNALLFLLQACLATSPPLPSNSFSSRRRDSKRLPFEAAG